MRKTRYGHKVYPLTAAQKFHFFYLDTCPKKAVVNIGISVVLQTDLDWNVLKESILKACGRCESMRLRLMQDSDGTWYQYIVNPEEDRAQRDVEFRDFTEGTEQEADLIMREWTFMPFDHHDRPLNRIVMIRLPGGWNGLYLLVDHLTMDAQALICFLKDVIELYCSTLYENVEAPKEMSSYIEQLQRDLAYEQGCRAKDRDTQYFHRLIDSSEPIYNGVMGTGKLEEARRKYGDPDLRSAHNVSDSVDAKLDSFHLETEPSSQLKKFCEENHVSLTCLLLMGLRTYFQKMNGSDDVSVNTAIARRATLKEKKCGGTRIHSFPFRTVIPQDATFLEGVYEIRDLQNQYFRHANYDPVDYFAYRRKVYPLKADELTYEPISLTYQPLSLKDKELEKLGDIKYRTKWYQNGATTQAVYLTVMHCPEDDGLDFNFEHQIRAISRQELEYFYYYLCRIMFRGAENPEMSIRDIIKMV